MYQGAVKYIWFLLENVFGYYWQGHYRQIYVLTDYDAISKQVLDMEAALAAKDNMRVKRKSQMIS